MVALNSQEERDRIGINSLERALAYSFFMLRTSIVGQDNKKVSDQNIKIGENIINAENASIILEAKLPYNSFLSNQNGGHLISYLEELNDVIPYTSEKYAHGIIEQIQPIPKTPSQIQTLEQYLLWSAASLLASSDIDKQYIDIKRFEHSNNGSYVQIKATLPFDYKNFLLGGNYISSVQRVSEYYLEFQFPNSSIIDNATVIDNDFELAN